MTRTYWLAAAVNEPQIECFDYKHGALTWIAGVERGEDAAVGPVPLMLSVLSPALLRSLLLTLSDAKNEFENAKDECSLPDEIEGLGSRVRAIDGQIARLIQYQADVWRS